MREIPLSTGGSALVDDADCESVLAAGPWRLRQDVHVSYAVRSVRLAGGRRTTQRLHTFLTGWAYVDHADGDGLNNQRGNLRPATNSQNQANVGRRSDNLSGYRGVSWNRRRQCWEAQIKVDQKTRFLGYFATANDAADAYDRAALAAWGEFARPNLAHKQASPSVPSGTVLAVDAPLRQRAVRAGLPLLRPGRT